jgi:hypothetical protein
MSYGTFGGRIVAVEKFISDNGKFRVLIALTLMKILGNCCWIWSTNNCIAVPVWFEICTLNGFPPDYYEMNEKSGKTKEKK